MMADKKNVLLTGAGGKISTVLRKALGMHYNFTGIDRLPVCGFNSKVSDLTDLNSIIPSFERIHTVIHLAADSRHTPDIGWDILVPNNITATANVFEAAKQTKVKRMIFFSSMHVNGLYEQDHPYSSVAEGQYGELLPEQIPLITHSMSVRPDGPYAVSKIFGETLGRYYAESFGMSVICIRLGTVTADNLPARDPRSYVSWFSHHDLAAMVSRCIDATGIDYEIFFGASANKWKIYDTPRALKVLDFDMKDDSEYYRP